MIKTLQVEISLNSSLHILSKKRIHNKGLQLKNQDLAESKALGLSNDLLSLSISLGYK